MKRFASFLAVLCLLFALPGMTFAIANTNSSKAAKNQCGTLSGGLFAQLPQYTYVVGPQGQSVWLASGDVNGDAKPDLVAAWGEQPGFLSVLISKGDGTFMPLANVSTLLFPASLAAADFNGDGKLDIASVGWLSFVPAAGGVGIHMGNGDGTFQPPVYYPIHGPIGVFMAVGDFNGDGKLDLAIAQGLVAILLNNGDGTFQPPVFYNNGQAGAVSVTVADFNGDGKLDLGVANACGQTQGVCAGPGSVSVLLGNGDGTFQPEINYPAMNPSYILAANLKLGGKPDLLLVDSANVSANGILNVLANNGDGTFQAEVSYGARAYSLATGDFNGDGCLDVVATTDDTFVNVLLGNGDSTLQPSQGYSTGGEGDQSVAVGDFNGDGLLDVAVSDFDGSVYVMLNLNGTGPDFSISASPLSPATVTAGAPAKSTVTVTSSGQFSAAVNLTCSVSPSPPLAPTCSLSPSSAKPGPNGSVTSALTIDTTATVAADQRSPIFYAIGLPIAGLAWFGVGLSVRSQRAKTAWAAILIVLFTGLLGFQTGCSGGQTVSQSKRTPAGTYTVTITGSTGPTQHSTTVNLLVQ